MAGCHLRQIVKSNALFSRILSRNIQHTSVCLTSCRTLTNHEHKQLERQCVPTDCRKIINRHSSTKSSDSENSASRRQALMYAIYGSFALGACLWFAIFLKWFKKKRLLLRGIQSMYVPEFKKLELYKYKDFVLPEFVINTLDDIEKFDTCADDIWVVSFPRSGTTWIQEIVYLINNNANTHAADCSFLDNRFPYLEFMTPGVKEIEKMQKPRFIKSHLPYSLLPTSVHEKKPKIVYIARNAKDVAVSYYYFVRLLYPVTRYDAEFKDFFELFVNDKVMYAPWSKHVQEFWENRNEDNIFFLTYEDLKRDTAGTIDRLANFFGKSLTKEQTNTIMRYCSFENMKINPTTNHSWFETYGVADFKKGDFIRKGCVGDWANHFDEHMNNKMNSMIAYRFMNSDLEFSYRGTHFVESDDKTVDSSE
ncbi:sulfotransferase [Mactra antiquata]